MRRGNTGGGIRQTHPSAPPSLPEVRAMPESFGPWFENKPSDGWDGVTVQVSEGRLPQVIEAIERLEKCRDIEPHLRIVHVLRGDKLVVSVVASDLARFYSRVMYPLGDYRPRFDAAHDYGSGEIRVEFIFEP